MGNIDRNKPQSFEEMANEEEIQPKTTVQQVKKQNWLQRFFSKW